MSGCDADATSIKNGRVGAGSVRADVRCASIVPESGGWNGARSLDARATNKAGEEGTIHLI